MSKVFNITVPKRDYKPSLNLILLWINRFIVKDTDRHHSNFYGGERKGDDYVIWFKDKEHMTRAEHLLSDIKDRGYPNSAYPY